MKALLFVRSSKQNEAAEQSQLDQLRSFAKHQGYDIAGEIVESGVEGLTLDRSGIRQMIEMVSDKGVDLVLAVSHSRFARSTMHKLALETLLRSKGAVVMTLHDTSL